MAEERKILANTTGHNVSMDNKERLRISGVLDVYGFDDTYVALETELGKMLVRGEGLKIGKLSLEHHDLVVTGFVYSLEYDDKKKGKGKGVFASMFR